MIIPDYPNYDISEYGVVTNIKTGKKLKPLKRKDGYLQVHLCKKGVPRWFMVHRLVAISFIPNPNKYKVVNHRDEIKTNNNVSNLEWCTIKYNTNYGTRNKRASIKLSQKIKVFKNGNLTGEYYSQRECAQQLGLKESSISKVLHGLQKSHGGYTFQRCK